jgi:cell filamentation protein
VFGELTRERQLRGLGREDFVARLAHHLANVNALHPFRDGNGRAQRAFFSELAREAGYRLDWQHADHQRNRDASVAAMRGDEQPLRDMLTDIVSGT